ncbi:hydrolase [Kushneria pakistanensis]|uniref:Hydrolase n=1 Tax=Kushneria pakistanensis TaxID=1508770 RepID=A0ABQ3FFA7_9GAMM|nr:HAD family hydrolase [Kushneria pakistanensis]GHC22031.1 hydrolase [Kushneria pakistanensis]
MYLNDVAALSLDLDDTLWDFDAAVRGAETMLYHWLLQHAPLTAAVLPEPASLQQYRQRMAMLRPDLVDTPARLRKASIHEVLRLAGEDPALSERAYAVFYAARQQVTFFEDALPALEWLSQRYPMAAISNGNADLDMIGIRHFFSVILFSRDLGIAKPDPQIFHVAATALDVAPAQILHIGDDWQLDVQGALSAGFRAAWLVRTAQGTTPARMEGAADAWLTLNNLHELCLMADAHEHPVCGQGSASLSLPSYFS